MGFASHAQIGSPIVVGETDGGRELLANAIRALQTAQVTGLAFSAADKKAHIWTDLRARSANAILLMITEDNQDCDRRNKKDVMLHGILLSV
jgi:hypothetical protein